MSDNEEGMEGEKVPYQQRDFSYYSCGTEQVGTLPAKSKKMNHNHKGISEDGVKGLIQRSFTLWIRPSLIIEKLNFLNNSYNASTSLTVTALNKMSCKHSIN
jgi:hypothetical protein